MSTQVNSNQLEKVMVQVVIDGKLYAVNVPDSQMVRNVIISTISSFSDNQTLGLVALPDDAKMMTAKDLKACQ